MAVPASQNLTITRGDTEVLVITINNSSNVPIDITGRTYRAQIRAEKDSSAIAASFSCVVTNAAGGVVTCTLPPVTSSTLAAGNYVWDFEETTGAGVVTTIIAGSVKVLGDVSR